MRKLLTEFIGTFFLVLAVGLNVIQGSALAPIGIGVMLMVLVYMGGHVSGAHYNPAVSIAVWMRGVLPTADLLPYIATQLVAAVVASLVVNLLTGQTFAPLPAPTATIKASLLMEVLGTFALVLVILNVAVSKKTTGNSYYGFAIGGTIMAAAFAGGGISGGAFNPAVGTGPTIVNAMMGGGGWAALWLYLVGPVIGGMLAAVVFRIQEDGS